MQYICAILWAMYIFHAIRLAERLHVLTAAKLAAAAAQRTQGQVAAANRRAPARPRWGPLKRLGTGLAQWTTCGEGQLEGVHVAGPDCSNSAVPAAV